MSNIVYFVHCYPPAVGGLEFLSGEIVKILLKGGHNVDVITSNGRTLDTNKNFSDWINVSNDPAYVHRLDLHFFWQRLANKLLNKLIFVSGTFSPWYFGPLLKYDQKISSLIKRADIIIGAGMPTKMFYDSYIFAKKYKKQLICLPAYHDVSYYNRSLAFRSVLNFAQKIILLSPLEKRDLLKNYSIDSSKITLLPYCPYTKKQLDKSLLKLENKLRDINNKIKNGQPVIIGFVGQITLRKNFQFFVTFIESNFKIFQKNGVKIKFLFAGMRTNSSKQVEELFHDYKDIVCFMYDFLDKTQIYNQIDIFINPSLEESLSLVNFEALYYGLPLLIPHNSAFASIFDNTLNELEFANYDFDKLIKEITSDNRYVCIFSSNKLFDQFISYEEYVVKLLAIIAND